MDELSRIRVFLAAVRRGQFRSAAAQAALYMFAGVTFLALVAPLAALAMAPYRSAGLAVISAVLLGASVAAALAFGVAVPLWRWRTDGRVARYVGQRKPEIASDLLSSLELGTSSIETTAASRHISGELVSALFEQTAQRVVAIPSSSLIDRTLRRAGVTCGAALLLHATVLIMASGALAEGWNRLLHPEDPRPFGDALMSREPLVGDLRITLEYPEYTGRIAAVLPSSSGDFRAMPGTTVVVETTALVPTRTARLVFEDADTETENGETNTGTDTGSSTGAKTDTAPATKPHGARSERREMVLDIGPDGRSLSVRFPVVEPAKYRFVIETPAGSRRVEELTRHIEIEPDQAPQVELYTPGDEIDVAGLKRIELAYIAKDDYGISKIELVWNDRGKQMRRELPSSRQPRPSAQGKFLWDLAEVSLEPGVRVSYHLEVTDNDIVLGPNIGRSRSFRLRVFSPRERHEQLIVRQRELFEHMINALGARLTVSSEDLHAHSVLQRATATLVVELGTLLTALRGDELAGDDLRRALSDMRSRLDKQAKSEANLLSRLAARQARGARPKQVAARLASHDAEMVAELEEDVILLANWIDRQQMENLLAIGDEIKFHQDRLRQLFQEYDRTGAPELLAEIEREMKFLERRLAEMAQKRSSLADDVLDRFVNAEAMQGDRAVDCIVQVRELLQRGAAAQAQRRLEQCMQTFDRASEAMERALQALRSDTFSEEERKFGELMDKLSDLTQDQRELAAGAAEIWDRYAEHADEMMREEAKETRKRVASVLDKLRKQLDKIPETGLTPFAREELEIVEFRLADVDKMIGDGDIAEALAMARQVHSGLEVIASELDAAIDDEQGGPFGDRTADAQREVKRGLPLARRLVEELEASTPSPGEIMTREDRRLLGRLRRRQRSVAERARRLAERAGQMSRDLPGWAGQAISQGIGGAETHMKRAGERMRARDPSGARQETRGAADALERTMDGARDAARQRQAAGRAGLRDQPIRIPGADEYRAPQEFREDILEAMKREEAPKGFGELVKRYYEELIR
ncbi:MAG: hypothetical protein MJE77_14965 [Proteobacteria bacterium]|nr:hypothetical protein [Pseudomonadota bacterium]